jgi:hypothetical protein
MSRSTSLICVDTEPTRTTKEKATATSLPPWHGKHGTKRVVLEYRHLQKQVKEAARAGASARGIHVPPVYDLSLAAEAQDDMSRWRFKMCDFDGGTEGGRHLNADLARLQREHSCDHLLLEVGLEEK